MDVFEQFSWKFSIENMSSSSTEKNKRCNYYNHSFTRLKLCGCPADKCMVKFWLSAVIFGQADKRTSAYFEHCIRPMVEELCDNFNFLPLYTF